MTFKTQTLVSFEQTDPGGVLFYAQVFSLTHKCLEEFIIHSKIGWNHWFQNTELAAPIRHCEADYLKPMFAGQNYMIELKVNSISETTVSFNFTIKNSQQDLCCKASTVHTFINKSTIKKSPLPDDIRKKLIEYQD